MGMAVSMTGSWRRLIIRENLWKISAKQAEAAELVAFQLLYGTLLRKLMRNRPRGTTFKPT